MVARLAPIEVLRRLMTFGEFLPKMVATPHTIRDMALTRTRFFIFSFLTWFGQLTAIFFLEDGAVKDSPRASMPKSEIMLVEDWVAGMFTQERLQPQTRKCRLVAFCTFFPSPKSVLELLSSAPYMKSTEDTFMVECWTGSLCSCLCNTNSTCSVTIAV